MLKFGQTKVAKEKFYGADKPIKIWDVNVDNVVVSNVIEIKNNFKYFIKDGNKDTKFKYFHKNNEKLLEKYKTICTKIKNLKNIKLNALPVHSHFSGLKVLEDAAECESFTIVIIIIISFFEQINQRFKSEIILAGNINESCTTFKRCI